MDATTILCEGAVVEAGAKVRASVLWPGALARSGAELDHCIVREGAVAEGSVRGEDI